MVLPQSSKLMTRVRFPYSAPIILGLLLYFAAPAYALPVDVDVNVDIEIDAGAPAYRKGEPPVIVDVPPPPVVVDRYDYWEDKQDRIDDYYEYYAPRQAYRMRRRELYRRAYPRYGVTPYYRYRNNRYYRRHYERPYRRDRRYYRRRYR